MGRREDNLAATEKMVDRRLVDADRPDFIRRLAAEDERRTSNIKRDIFECSDPYYGRGGDTGYHFDRHRVFFRG